MTDTLHRSYPAVRRSPLCPLVHIKCDLFLLDLLALSYDFLLFTNLQFQAEFEYKKIVQIKKFGSSGV